MRIAARPLTIEADGIPGYIAHPLGKKRGPGLLLIHQHSGLTGYLKTAAYNLAKLGYTTVIPQSVPPARLPRAAAHRHGHGNSKQNG